MTYDLERVLQAQEDIKIFRNTQPDAETIRASASALLDL